MCDNRKMEIYVEWLRGLLEEERKAKSGKTASDLAKDMGLAAPRISEILNGERDIKLVEVGKIAKYFGVEPPKQIVHIALEPRLVPEAGIAEAGTFREVEDLNQDEPKRYMAAPDMDFPDARQFFVGVAGDSMNDLKPRPIMPGDRLLCVAWDDIEKDVTLRDGMTVIVERTRDGGHAREWSVKQLEIYEDRHELHPRSTNQRHRPIIINREYEADDGTTVAIIGLVRSIQNDLAF